MDDETGSNGDGDSQVDESTRHLCYILFNDLTNKTYNGYTVNLERRLRQHNSIIKGGARATTVDSKVRGNTFWKYLLVVEADGMDKRKALSLEWHIRYPTCKRPRPREFSSAEGRIRALAHVFKHDKFQHLTFKVSVSRNYLELCRSVLLGIQNVQKIEPLI